MKEEKEHLKGRASHLDKLRPHNSRARNIFFLAVIVVNVALAVFVMVKKRPGISRYLLLILGANMALYKGYYCLMKVYWWKFQKR